MQLKLFLVLCVGFVASFVGAMCMGFFLRMTLQMTSGSGNFFEPEVAGIVDDLSRCGTWEASCRPQPR